MKLEKVLFIMIFSLFVSLTASAAYDNKECDNKYCSEYEWYNNGGRFDPHSIHWPLHYTGEKYKDYMDGGHHHLEVAHGGHYGGGNQYQSKLSHYRTLPECPDPYYLRDGIKMPDPFECEAHVYDKPKWKDSNCSSVLAGYEDQVVYIDGPSCSKILRHWTIIDWCKWKPNTISNTYNEKYVLVHDSYENKSYFAYGHGYHDVEHDGYYTYTQVIKIVDKHAPELVSCEDVSYNVPRGECDAYVKLRNKIKDTGPCPGDRMTVELVVKDYDGKVVKSDWLYAQHNKDFDANLGKLSAGHYYIHWSFKDGCGNSSKCVQKLTVEDDNAPHLLCIKDLSTSISDQYGTAIWAKDFVHKLEGKCDNKEVTLSFQPNDLEMSRHFDCDANLGIQLLTVYATDSKGNQSSCNVELFIADHNACSDTEMQVAGAVFDRNRQPLPNVEVDVYKDEEMVSTSTSDANGHYNLYGIPNEKSIIVMKPHMPDFTKEGLDQTDLLFLLRHITRVQRFTSVLQYAAADINSDRQIDMQDYWDLAALIYDLPGRDLSGISTWKFFDALEYYGGQRSASKLVVPIPIKHFRHRYDIMGVKVGDIDFSVKTSKSKAQVRSTGNQKAIYTVTNNGSAYDYNINLPATTKGHGMTIEFEDINAEALVNIRQGNESINYFSYQEGKNLVVTIASEGVITNSSINVQLSSDAKLSTNGTYVHDASGELIEDHLTLEKAGTGSSELSVSPNPFSDLFELRFSAIEAGKAKVQLIAVDGKIHQEENISVYSGDNQIRINTSDLSNGLYIMRLQMDDNVQIQRVTKSRP